MTYRQPAEWAQHDWAWIGFPSNPAEWPNAFEGTRMQAAAFANAVHANGKGEEVRLVAADAASADRSEEHTSELQSLMRISYAVFCLKKKNKQSTKLL